MSVTSTLNKHVYTGNGVTTTFPFTFNVFAASDIHVYLTNPTVGTDVEITTDFLIVPNGGEYPCSSGNIVYPGYEAGTEPPADAQPDVLPDGWKITILRNIEPLQTTTYPTNSTTIRPKVIEKDFDKAIMLIQQITEALGRAFVGAVSSEANTTLPAPVAGSTLVWDGEGNLVNGTPVNGTFTNEDLQNAIDVIATMTLATQEEAEAGTDNVKRMSPLRTKQAIQANVDIFYPVGSIYMSVDSTSPATLFGGTWEQIKDAFLLACGDTYANGTTGGEATHMLTIDEMPTHKHSMTLNNYFYNASTSNHGWGGDDITNGTYTNDTSYAGGGQAHNNMPPYLAVYMWKRTA